ncbi:MAG: DUF4058 family protein [Chloroflexaceae bacterium]|nr:DUF4058 family protein [Chloroflexaceae bacterium]
MLVLLHHPDTDATLQLTPLLQQRYCNARYDLQVDYT